MPLPPSISKKIHAFADEVSAGRLEVVSIDRKNMLSERVGDPWMPLEVEPSGDFTITFYVRSKA